MHIRMKRNSTTFSNHSLWKTPIFHKLNSNGLKMQHQKSLSMRWPSLQPTKLCASSGIFNGCVVVILLVSESTHNFLDPSIQQRVHLQSQSTTGLLVKVANGDSLLSTGKCVDNQCHMQGKTHHTDFYVLTLGGCDIVLGVQWLSTWGQFYWILFSYKWN